LDSLDIDESVQRSRIRDQLAARDEIDDVRYSGKVASRKDLGFDQLEMEDERVDDDDEDEEFDDDSGSETEVMTDVVQAMMVKDPELERQLAQVEEEEKSEDRVVLIKQATEEEKRNADSKGQHVKNQRILWEVLMDIRIKMQKPLILANRMPERNVIQDLISESPDLMQSLESARNEFLHLQKKLDQLRNLLQAPAQLSGVQDSQHSDLRQSWNELEPKLRESRKRHFDVIDKWSLKTQLAQGKLNKSKGSNGLKSLNQSVSKQIMSAMEDKERLMQRARTPRVHYAVLVEEKSVHEEVEPISKKAKYRNIYDDTDFYHKLLKEMMSAGSGSVVGAEYDQISESISEASAVAKQRRLSSKDMKASKGRKIRYTVESKLVNFMAPEPLKGNMESISSDLFLTMYKNMMSQQKCSVQS
jgi:protein AATF/BFR2